MSKYKYYFKKPRSEIVKDIFRGLLVAGVIYVAAGSPYFTLNLMRALRRKRNRANNKEVYNSFYRLRKQGLIKIEKRGRQIYIRLTEKGRKKAGMFQINDLKIKKPKKWDGKWRLVLFDIAELYRVKREAFRGKLKELGFCPFQKSVWINPYNCRDEIELLRDFFGLSNENLCLIVADDIGDDIRFRKIFNL